MIIFFGGYRGIDYALSVNDIPGIANRLPSLIIQVISLKVFFTMQENILPSHTCYNL